MSHFLEVEMRFGYYYFQLMSEFADVNNLAWIYNFAESIKSTHNSCLWKNIKLNGFTFVAKRVRNMSNIENEDLIYCLDVNLCLPSNLYFCNMIIL